MCWTEGSHSNGWKELSLGLLLGGYLLGLFFNPDDGGNMLF
jgi:hypothetical protein